MMLARFSLALLLCLPAAAAHAETRAVIDTSHGSIELLLDETRAPKTVANFAAYARQGFYNNTVFHRVIPGFMIQGGGLTADLAEKATARPIANEAANGLKNQRYTIAMARTAQPHSATSQFFINLKDNDFLNHRRPDIGGYGYAVFGQVSGGFEVVEKIAAQPTASRPPHENVPLRPVLIHRVRILD